jgi:hypothetical protein
MIYHFLPQTRQRLAQNVGKDNAMCLLYAALRPCLAVQACHSPVLISAIPTA